MTKENIQALGIMLGTYNSDLIYIRDFHRFKKGEIESQKYLDKKPGTFKSFINEFRVARNIEKTKTDILLDLTMKWIESNDSDNVDEFANYLKAENITHQKVMTSLASKILFLNNPWTIMPIDRLVKKAIGTDKKYYSEYLPLTQQFRIEKKIEMSKCLESIQKHIEIIEQPFKKEIENIEQIRENRYLDKVLWTMGK